METLPRYVSNLREWIRMPWGEGLIPPAGENSPWVNNAIHFKYLQLPEIYHKQTEDLF